MLLYLVAVPCNFWAVYLLIPRLSDCGTLICDVLLCGSRCASWALASPNEQIQKRAVKVGEEATSSIMTEGAERQMHDSTEAQQN